MNMPTHLSIRVKMCWCHQDNTQLRKLNFFKYNFKKRSIALQDKLFKVFFPTSITSETKPTEQCYLIRDVSTLKEFNFGLQQWAAQPEPDLFHRSRRSSSGLGLLLPCTLNKRTKPQNGPEMRPTHISRWNPGLNSESLAQIMSFIYWVLAGTTEASLACHPTPLGHEDDDRQLFFCIRTSWLKWYTS